MTVAMEWWGYDTQRKTWVYLDRTHANNAPDSSNKPLVFVDCDNLSLFEVQRKDWNPPRFIYEGAVPEELSDVDLSQLTAFKNNISAIKACLSQRTSYQSPPTPITPPRTHTESIRLTPEQIRARYAQGYCDQAWSEIISYVALMKRLGIRDQGKCNEYITRADLWDEYSNIRAMNDHGYGRELEGITRSAYALVCKLINLQNGFGAPLLHSRKY
ncbi:hypothetical protein [Alteromonas sp. ASW11-130]|uniref:hypothetical protein n=1 Tax=Alteromonas sp. ASW11-130 TaxID=3015775 RepID=UPI0022420EA3|nr:hypothetical protein [Alteromonas sp. ASW11-130]MCW8093215.1 hypothetical protein [Alteromonas sp. ASW11-130]